MSNTTSKLDQLSPEQRRLLALRLKQRKTDEPRAPTTEEGAGGEYPLAFTQQRLWMLDRLQPGSPAYNLPQAIRVKQPMDPAIVQRAIGEIVRRHGVLRTRFEVRDGTPVQVVEPFTAWHLPFHDLSALPQAEREAQLVRLAGEEARAPFALDREPAFRACLVRMGPEDHAVLATMHHIVSDGWSLNVFWREFGELMSAFYDGLASPLPPLAMQFGEHARRERERLSGPALDGLLAWWRHELAGAPTLLEIPTDRPRPAVASQRGAAYITELDPSFADRVGALAVREGTTPFNVQLAAFQLLLGRYAGTDDLLVGTAIAGRRTSDLEPLIGFFANTLVLRGDLSGEPTFRELVARVHATTMGAFEHQDLPFERLVEEMAPERTLAYSPLVQALFVQQVTFPRGEGAAVESVHQEMNTTKFDLTFGVMQDRGRSWAGAEYAADLFERATIERMVHHYDTLLNAALSAPDAPVASLEMMPAEERDAVRAMGAAVAHHPVSTTLHAAFAAQAARTPHAPALTYGERTMTYARLEARANRLAARLRTRGVEAGALVGLCVERSLETVAGVLGILKAGAAYLPLDPAYPDDRLAYMLEDSGALVVVTAGDAANRLPSGIERIRMDEEEDSVDADAFVPVEVSPEAPAYVIYTSGSTGRPKGVQVTHANVVRLMTATDPWFGFGADDVWTLFHSYAFDFSVWEIWGALLYGGRLVVVPFEVSRDPARFHALLRDERVTVLNQTPSAFRQLIRADDDAAAAGAPADLALRYVIFGGEALDPASLRSWVDRRGADRPRLVNMYGITETTVHVTYRVIGEADVRAGSASPIGIPIPDLSIHLLDRRGRTVPIGLAGEMYVGGGGVARGYLHRPELTAQRFVPDPFSDKVADRLYRSGDLARRLADGSLEFLGRADDQVKVRGFRIELGEIESVLLEHPSVREAVVLVRGSGDERRLVAWTVAAESVTAAELRAHLLAHLPEYMVPSAFVPMDRLPLTRNGKTDRRALPEPEAADVAGAEYVAPRTQTEQVIAALWSELLGVERVGATDRFFDLGGQSLLATRAVSRVREALGVEVPVRAVFEHPALDAFAREVDRLLRADAGVEAPPIRPADRGGDLPLTFAQERLWFVDRLEPGSPVYHMPFHYLLRGALNVDALRSAFTEIVRRHETLRTALPFTGEQPVQRILPAGPVELPLHDLSAIADEAERDAATLAVMRDVADRAFDLERGPLFRVAVARWADDEHVLVVNLHHVISDGWSVGVLWNELSALYTAFARGEASPLPEPALQYGDFAVWQRGWLTGDVLEAQLGYWRRKLTGAPPLLELPTDRPRPAVQTYAGANESVLIGGEDAAAVLALGRREGSTLFMVLLAAMDVVFGRLAGQDDVVIGTPIAGRTRAETEGMIGLFLNSLALRTDLSGEPTFRELLRRVRETTLEAYAHQDLPFERILEELAPERSLSHSPLFQVMLNLSNFAEGDVSLPGLEVQPIGGAGDIASKFDLTLYAGESPDGIVLHLVYNTALFDAPRVRSMLEQMTGVLRQAAEDANRPIHVYTLLTGDAAAVLPDPAAPLSAEWRGSVPAIFARHAARTPDAVAVEDPAERWTYAELDRESSRIAQRLIADGVRPGDVVAILGHRSAPIVRALLATMKAGGAFLILDPAYPPSRLAEYVRIARPTGFLPIESAGDVPAELADALRESVVSTLPLAIRGSEFIDKAANPAEAHEPPPAVSGEVASLGEPEGADSAASRSASNPSAHQPPPVFFGGGASLSERRGRGGSDESQFDTTNFIDKAANSAEAHQPPPAVSGEVASLSEPEGASPAPSGSAGGFADKVADFTPVEIGPDSLAYLSFTSGTTGKPKAVMGRHGSLTHFTPWLAERFELGAADRFSLLSGLAHDPLHRDVFTPLQLGAAVVAPDPDEVGTPGYLAQWMRDTGITITHLTPAMGQLLVDVPGGLGNDVSASDAVLPLSAQDRAGRVQGEGAPRVDSLRRAFFVGDVLTRTDVGRMHRLAPNLQVINYYGSTETQRAVAHFVVPRDLSGLAKETIPVGTGLPDVQVLIRNAAGERVGVGEVGEIWMRSPHVALGYLGDPELSASRFIPNPWTGDAADPTYRTGDLGRYRPDGVAEIAGRADQQVKIRGFRIEPGEIEAALRAHASVRDVVVVPRGEGDARRLVAYVVADGEPAPGELREWLRASVPEYMVPAAWVFLPALPVTPNGKVDRKALPEPQTDGVARGFVAPRTLTEVALADVWAGLMKTDLVGADDDFFALGGHSLLATKLVARVRDALAVELPLRTLFEAPTLGAMAAAIDRLLRADAVAAAPPIVRRPHDGVAPASFAQERLWFVDKMDGGGAVYHIPSAQHLAGPVDPEAMRRAVEEVVRRHETLRTALPEVDGVPVQRISPPGRVELPFIDLSALSQEERDAEAGRLAERNANEPFDLEAGPLFRASLVRLADEEHLLLVNLHHAIGDGWSIRVLLGEIATLHAAFRRGEPDPLPPLPVQYADYAAWQREWLSGPVLDAQLAYWRGALAGAPPMLALPADRPRPEVQGHRGASESIWIAPEDAARVAELGRREGATLFMVLLAAVDVVLARWSGQQDVVIGTPVAGRTRSELEGLIGLFLNSLALRTDLSGDPSFRVLLGRVRQATLDAYAHQDLPFERILEELKPERSLGHTPVFQVMLNLLNYGDGGSAAPSEGEMTSLGAGAQLASKFDLTLYAAEAAEGIALHAVYDADLFDAARMRSMLAQVAAVLRQAADDADRPAAALSLVTDEDRALVDSAASPVLVRTRAGDPAGIGELGEVWMRGPDGALRPMGGAGRYRPDGSVELATAPVPSAPAPMSPVESASKRDRILPSPRGTSGEGPTPTERAVAAIWAEVLGVDADAIAPDADFFALGGHSLRATQVLSRIRARLGARLPIRAFFTAPTVAALASAIDAQAPSASTESAVSTEPAVRAPETESRALTHSRTHALTHSPTDALPHFPPGVYPLSFAQQRLWLLMQLGTNTALNLASAARMRGALDDWALERALDEIVRRHQTLRTKIETRDGEPVQVASPPRPLRLRAEDVRPADGESIDDALRRMTEEEAVRPFAVEGPFLRVRLLRAADDDHVLLWTIHHLMADGWSLGIFQDELLTLYRAFATETEPALAPLEMQYGEHALHQRHELSGGALDELVGWWKERLAGAPGLLELPTDRPRPAQPSGAGASFWFGFDDGTAVRVDRVAREHGATPFMVLLAVFQALLARWSGQDDVVVGTPIANRTRPELEPVIGFFANTLAIRGDLSGAPAFDALLARVREATLGAYEHQDVPFERLVEELNPERSLSHSPVFQVMFALQNAPKAEGGEELAGLELSGVPRARETTQFDLFLSVHDTAEGLAARLEYATDLFGAASMEHFAEQFIALLEGALDDPAAPVAALPILGDEERARLLRAFSGPAADVPALPLHALVEAQAARTPDDVALVFGDARVTYAELDARANRLAHHLRGLGAGPEARVGICLMRSAETVVAILAVLKAGAAYLPLDPAYPADRLAYMLEDSGAPMLVTQSSLRGLLPADGVRIVSVDEEAAAIAARPADRPEAGVDADNVAYVIYTSGSTGRPKGVVVTHGTAAAFLAGMDDRVGGPVPGTWLAVTRISFDIHVLELLWTLARGFRVVVQPEVDQVRAGESLAEQIRRHEVTHLQCTPVLAGMLIAESGAESLRGLHRVLLGGEALTPALAAQITAVVPGGLVNLYGPTETTVWCTTHEVAADAGATIPIGRPIANTRTYVLDDGLRSRAHGVPGELYVAGAGVTRGYLHRPALTAERFVPDPFSSRPGARMYRTGDLGRLRSDGALEFRGRVDFQVKVRGFRIELGEIEAVLLRHPSVADAVVLARQDEGGARLAAYVTGRDGAAPDVRELRDVVSRALPDYMVPAAFVVLDAIPVTPNGKVDRRALPEPHFAAQAEGYVAPRTPTEEIVAGVWAELLGVDRVGARDGFFALGGHSLLGTRVVSRIRERLGVEVPLATLFEAPRLDGFTARVDDAVRQGLGVRVPPIRHSEADTAPLSFAQERLWFIDRLEPGSVAYNMSPVLRLRGAVNVDALVRALAEVVRRHEPLRTTFPQVDGAPVQRIHPAGPFHLPLEELDSEAELSRRVNDWSAQPFDLRNGPVFRARLLRLPDDEHVLLLAMHHIVSDGWSNGLLHRELFALYDAFSAGLPSPLAPLPARYSEYAAWQREWLSGEELRRQVEFWRAHLHGAPALLQLPLDRPRPAVQSYRGAASRFVVAPRVVEGLRGVAREQGATLFMALLAAFSALLGRWSGQDDVVVGTPIAGRTSLDVEELIGLFVNTLALRTELRGDPSFRALLSRVRASTLDAYAHQDLPFEKLVEEIQPERSLSHAPIFQAMFTLQNAPEAPAASDAGMAAAAVVREGAQAKVDLQLNVVEGYDGALYASLVYAVDLFAPETMDRMAGQLSTLLAAIAAAPDAPVAALPILDEDERARLLNDFAGPAAAYPDVPLHALFEAQAARTPDAGALVFGDARMTYAELDANANRLAHLLRARGIGAERTVAVLMERSMEMVVALYGILKAGAAYVPVDPEYPADRVSYMLDDSAAALVLTQGRWMDTVPAGADALALDEPGVLDAFPAHRPEPLDAGTDRLAYVIYTSGSTGRPKGAMNAHRGVVNRILWMQDAFGLSSEDAVLQKTPFSFDVSVWEFFWPLAVGARLVIAAPGAHRDPAALTELIDRERITTLHFVPSMLRAWLDGGDASRCASLRKVMSSGEALPADIVERFFEALPSAELHNLYGPTEAAVDVTHWPCVPRPAHGVVPIGAPVANTRMYVLDGRGAPCPIGVPGELWIAGVQVGRGYWRRPFLTAERFVADPFATQPGSRMYHTGDRARWLGDGALEYLGRTDFQVKVRGFRIEPGEIEAALKQHPAVADAVVVALGEDRDARLVAYLAAREGAAVPADAELRERLSRSMPDYMVPSAFVALDAIPLTPSGKVDRRALPQPDAPAAGGYVVPRDVTELEVARIWGEALGVPRVGAADDFFRLGGHSLLALRMMAAIRERFGRELPLAALFRHPTVAAFAEALRREGADADDGRLLVTLNAGGALPPLFFFPPAGGTVTHYADLARHLGPEQPFLALHAPGLTGDEAPLETVEAMAERYLEEIRAAQPHGPYWLGGWSAGGTVAYEAARRLRAAGEPVALLAIVDSHAPDGARRDTPPVDRVELFRRFARSIVTEDEALLDTLVDELRALPPEEQLAGLSRWIARHGGQVMDAELERVGRSITVFAATARAVHAYRDPPPLDVPIALFVASEGKPEDAMGPDVLPDRWRPFAAGGLTVHTVSGAHVHLPLDPAAETLAAHLREVLEQVRGG
jgi:amino acid adenylation domain-containing protein